MVACPTAGCVICACNLLRMLSRTFNNPEEPAIAVTEILTGGKHIPQIFCKLDAGGKHYSMLEGNREQIHNRRKSQFLF